MGSVKINQLQILQQNLQNLQLQKQQIQSQVVEYDSTLTELKTTNTAYKIIGKIMVSGSKEDIIKDLKQKKEVAGIRLNNFTKQEKRLKESLEKIQKEIMEELKKGK